MRYFIRLFFRTLRVILGPFMVLWEWLTTPKGVVRSATAQAEVATACGSLALYQFKTCPFCIKVRREMAALSLPIEKRDAQFDETHRAELLAGGGAVKVPCLKITDAQGNVQWLYESTKIIDYLQQRFR